MYTVCNRGGGGGGDWWLVVVVSSSKRQSAARHVPYPGDRDRRDDEKGRETFPPVRPNNRSPFRVGLGPRGDGDGMCV